ncbi:BTB/POZ domain-containing protein At5g48130 [Andrographis paniculata]|uniref:BTB/POZ domain-containing protein At5g48130 n=1 Tax=Andrographis paniculata TaxID=175694 RepID=UPI0021E77707|nr:BTB/POZ domain-containing protein At5g48130 [Andrographis paniculata]XP_051114796.1 BTB/POZ domain-containing protein At5g48130 [Andrographis paniculata]
MNIRSPQDSSLLSSTFPSPNVAALLKIKILSWSQETGLPVCILVRIGDRTFNLHKDPFTRKSGYFSEKLRDSNEVELPPNFPGGAETFEMIALFVYGSSTLVDPFNVAALRCAAEYLHMTEEYGPRNLCEHFDVYLNQVVLQSWNDTLIVLQKCQSLLPWAEDLLIISRCIETLAFMACMEILDPERRRDQPVGTMEALAAKPWTDQTVEDIVSHDLWINDLIALPLAFFKRVIGSLRRQGMKEKYVSPIILFYADRWVISQRKRNAGVSESMKHIPMVLQEVIDLLPVPGEKASNSIPAGFYFSLLSTAMEIQLRNNSIEKIQNCIAPALHLAKVEHFLSPKNFNELGIMESMFRTYFWYNIESDCTPAGNTYAAAELWDEYLIRIAADSGIAFKRFVNLIEVAPQSSRRTHDHLYHALNAFLKLHPDLLPEEKEMLCKYLNCQKLSQEVCIEAVQNELMPLRLIVQALFMQQLNTQQAFRECSDSFRHAAHFGEHSGSLSSSRYPNSRTPHVNLNAGDGVRSRPLSLLLQTDLSRQRQPDSSSEISRKDDYESTSFRIQTLEKELVSLKRRLQSSVKHEKGSKKIEPVSEGVPSSTRSSAGKKRNSLGRATNCVGNVSFANRLLKALQRMRFFGRGGSKSSKNVVKVRTD